MIIDDPLDPRLNDIRDLNKSDSRPDKSKGLVIAEGALVVSRLVESAYPVRCIVGTEPKLAAYESAYGLPNVPIYCVSRATLAAVAGFDMHRGLVAAADRIEEPSFHDVIAKARTLCILEGVGDHENIGSIFRNAAGLAIDGILLGNGCADPLYRRSVRVSMGHVLRTPFAHVPGKFTNWQRNLDEVKEAGFQIVAMTPSGTTPLWEALDPTKKIAIMVGGEGPGLTEHAMKAADIRAAIPMAPGTDSLNVATSAAVAFYEINRRA